MSDMQRKIDELERRIEGLEALLNQVDRKNLRRAARNRMKIQKAEAIIDEHKRITGYKKSKRIKW